MCPLCSYYRSHQAIQFWRWYFFYSTTGRGIVDIERRGFDIDVYGMPMDDAQEMMGGKLDDIFIITT
jgi:hypothetical protein